MLLVHALVRFVFLFAAIAVALFASAGTLHAGRAWVKTGRRRGALALPSPRKNALTEERG
jgi:hypothetical protein